MPGLFRSIERRSGRVRPISRRWLLLAFAASYLVGVSHTRAIAYEVLYLQPIINGQTVDGILPVTVTPQGVKVPAAALKHIGLQAGIGSDAGDGYRLFPPMGPVKITIDNAAQTAIINVPGADIQPHRQVLSEVKAQNLVTQTATGGYATYDLTVNTPIAAAAGAGPRGSPVQLAGGVNVVLFSPEGELLAQTSIDAPAARFAVQPLVARLSTTYEFDEPAIPAALRIGDVITASPGWARDNLAGGVQFGTDDALQPARVTFPAPQIGGTLADPSAVSLLVNNAQAYNTNLAAGPFSLVGVPVITGLNEITVQTRDTNGQISSTTVPFYASATMLQPGLAEYSATLGYLRQNYGTLRDGYRVPALDASYSIGVTDDLTAAIHTEESPQLQLAGVSLETTNVFGDFAAAIAASRHARQTSGLASLQFTRAGSFISLAGGLTYAMPGYVDLAAENGATFPRLNWYASAGAALPYNVGSLHLAYTNEQYGIPAFGWGNSSDDGNGGSHFILGSYTKEIFGNWSAVVAVSLGDSSGGGRSTQSRGISADISLPLGGFRRGDVSFSDGTGETPAYGEGVSALPSQAVGWGGAAQNQTGNTTSRSATIQVNTLAAEVDAQVDQFEGQSAGQLQARGSLALLDGLHASAPINSAFAVFDVGYPHIPVYLENRLEGETNAAGRAFLPGLLPYYPNRLSVATSALPMSANFQSNAITVTPPLYGGVVARLPISRLTGVLIRLTLANGQYPPAGALLNMAHASTPVVIGYDGEALIPQAPAHLDGTVVYAGGQCTVATPLSVSLQNYLVPVPVACAPSH